MVVKEMSLDLICGYQRGQNDASFLVLIALTEYLLDPSECVPDQFCCILSGDRKGEGHAVGVLGFIPKPAGHEKDSQYPSSHMMPS